MFCVLWLVTNNGSWPITQVLIRWCLRGGKYKVPCIISFRGSFLLNGHLVHYSWEFWTSYSLSNYPAKGRTTLCVTYWPSTEPSIKRCTCVNKRKNSGSRWMSYKNITRTQTAWVSCSWCQLGTRCWIENQRQTEGFGPSVTHGWATKPVLLWSEELGPICSSLSPSPTHLSHTNKINTFENKVWEIYFYKEICSFVHWSSSLCLIIFRIYMYMYMYSAIQHMVDVFTGYLALDYHRIILFTNPSARPGYDTKSIFKRSLTGLNSEFSFS